MAMFQTMTPQQRQMLMQQMQMQNSYMVPQNNFPMANPYASTAPIPQAAPAPVPAPPAKKEKLRVKLKPEERGIYSSLFDLACPKGGSKIEGKEGVAFFRRSNLPSETLKQIWTIAAQTDSMSLTRDEFYIALRLVALAQSGKEVSEKAITIDLDAPLPKFESLPTTSTSSGSSNPISHSNEIQSTGKYSISEEDIQQYVKICMNVDSEQKGYLTQSQMKGVIAKTNLPGNVANTLFMICDEQGTGNFQYPMAVLMIHFAVLAMKNTPLPRAIPEDVKRKVINSVSNYVQQPSRIMNQPPPMKTMDAGDNLYSAPIPTMTKPQIIMKNTAPASAMDDSIVSMLRKEIEERKSEINELRDEESETKEKLEKMRERNKNLATQLQRIKDELASLKKTTDSYKNMPAAPMKAQPPMNYEDPYGGAMKKGISPQPQAKIQNYQPSVFL